MMETEFVLCEVGIEVLYVIYMNVCVPILLVYHQDFVVKEFIFELRLRLLTQIVIGTCDRPTNARCEVVSRDV